VFCGVVCVMRNGEKQVQVSGKTRGRGCFAGDLSLFTTCNFIVGYHTWISWGTCTSTCTPAWGGNHGDLEGDTTVWGGHAGRVRPLIGLRAFPLPNVLSLGTGDAWLVGYAMAACCGTTMPRDKWSEITLLQQPWPCFF